MVEIRPQPKTAREIAWSHSALSTYSNCPHRYAREKVTKDMKPTFEGPAIEWGNKVHKDLEMNLLRGDPLSPETAHLREWPDWVRSVARAGGFQIHTEAELAFTNRWTECAWFGQGAWMRVKVDVLLSSAASLSAIVVDWKTGSSRYGEKGQDDLNAAAVFIREGHVQTVTTLFPYFKDKVTNRRTYTRDQLPQLLTPKLQTLNDVAASYTSGIWPKKPSGLCGYCPVTDCEHWKAPKR